MTWVGRAGQGTSSSYTWSVGETEYFSEALYFNLFLLTVQPLSDELEASYNEEHRSFNILYDDNFWWFLLNLKQLKILIPRRNHKGPLCSKEKRFIVVLCPAQEGGKGGKKPGKSKTSHVDTPQTSICFVELWFLRFTSRADNNGCGLGIRWFMATAISVKKNIK